MDPKADTDQLFDALASGVVPEDVPELRRAGEVLPVFELARSLFYNDPTDAFLKLGILLSLAGADGRFSKERIRSLVPFLRGEALDPQIDSLYRGGWLELRALDNSYRISPLGAFFLSVLVGARFRAQTATNLLVGAAKVLAFGDQMDDDEGSTTRQLLGMLLADLETRADVAREVLARGRPRQLIRFSRIEMRQQLEHVSQVLSAVEERQDAASDEFGRIVRIHDAIQQILRAHEGLARRLAEWNLKKLETTDAGYSLSALGDAVLGATDDELLEAVASGALDPPAPAVCLSTDRLLARHRSSRASVRQAREAFLYESPEVPEPSPQDLASIDPVTRVRRALLARVADLAPGESVPAWDWLEADSADFADAVVLLGLLSRIEGLGDGVTFELDEGVRVALEWPGLGSGDLRDATSEGVLASLERSGRLVRLADRGLHPAILLRLQADRP